MTLLQMTKMTKNDDHTQDTYLGGKL